MKKRECPCCGQKPQKKRAEEQIAKWFHDVRIDRLMIEKLEEQANARKTEWMKALNKLEGLADELERAASPTTDAGELIWKARKQPRDARPANVWRRTNLSYMPPKEDKELAEASAADVGKTLSAEEKKAKQLEHQRAYNREYYRRKRSRIKELRDARLAKNRARKRVGNSATKAATLQ
jgi:hypothetical protein